MANPCRPGMCVINDSDERATVTAIARHAGADDGNRFAVTAGHACHAGQAVFYFPMVVPRASLGRCVVSLYPATDLCSCAATDSPTWGAPYGFGWEPELFVGNLATLTNTAAIFLGCKQPGPVMGVIGAVTPIPAGTTTGLSFSADSGPCQTWPGDSGGPLYIRSSQGGLLLVGMLVSQTDPTQPMVFQYPGPGLNALGLVLAT